MTTGNPLARNPAGGNVIGSLEGPVPIIRLYGVTRQGRSVMASIHGFTPYFYVSLPPSADMSDGALGQLRSVLDQRLKERTRGEEKKTEHLRDRNSASRGSSKFTWISLWEDEGLHKGFCGCAVSYPGIEASV